MDIAVRCEPFKHSSHTYYHFLLSAGKDILPGLHLICTGMSITSSDVGDRNNMRCFLFLYFKNDIIKFGV